MLASNMEAIAFIIIFIIAIAAVLIHAWRQPPTDYWITYQEKLEQDSRWYRCQNGPGCDWPENCHPGDCRRPDDR